ncbi:hypothetical protein [Streptomyces sp. SID13031]|uniref:hypothetical protein n=1 Tax=Streptomyces sp. SID13031 TaxID=2706046 RepID=UPI0013CB5AE6|nr:hypothetical protein [Streptomyces sp. SID13031]NEA37447.1 hypothetical protein [Streptomyces sp. SID13031]
MSAETMAERRYRVLEPNRAVQLEQMKAELARLGDRRSLRRLKLMEAGFKLFDRGRFANPMNGMLQASTLGVKQAMIEIGADQDKVASAFVGSSLREDVAAQMTPFSDGSGLAVMSDAVLSLVLYYSQYAGAVLADPSPGQPKKFGPDRGTTDRGNTEVLTGLLRYYNVHQRVFGVAGKLGWRTPRGASRTSRTGVHALRFVLAHELSHHVLGHDSALSGFSPGEHLPVCSGNQRLELDADDFAYRAVQRAAHNDRPGSASADDPAAITGALIAMMAIHSTERALFVRRGCTHPPASVRAEYLLHDLSPELQDYAESLSTELLSATEGSSMFSPEAEPFDWAWYAASRKIDSSHPDDYLQHINTLDQIQCFSVDRLVEATSTASIPSPAEGAPEAAAGNLTRALELWGLTEADRHRLTDPGQALTFHTLYKLLQSRFQEQGLPHGEHVSISLVTAQLLSKSIAPTV